MLRDRAIRSTGGLRCPSAGSLVLAIGLGLGMLTLGAPAAAFCRSTTCSGDCPRDDDGCKTSGKPLFWKTACVGFSLQRDGSEHIPLSVIRDITIKSFVAWSDVECADGIATMAFQELDPVACHRAEYNRDGGNANVIMFQDYKWTYTTADNTLAKTTVTYDKDTGEILDADIELNHAYNEFTTGDDFVVYDLQAILTHEIGHLVGLDHSPDLYATMNASYESGSTDQRTLESDDQAGVCAIYPPGRQAVCDTSPRGGFASECGQAQQGGPDDGCSLARPPARPGRAPLVALWLGLGLSLAWRRRRPRSTS